MTLIFNRGARTRRSQLCIYIISFVLFVNLVLFYFNFNGDVYKRIAELPALHHTSLEKLISCYNEEDSQLPAAEHLKPSMRSIFFLESSCRGDLDSRQVCAVESAARANPEWEVHVLFLSPISLDPEKKVTGLTAIKNVKLARIHLLQYTRGTPVESLVLGNAFNQSLWPVTHVSDVLRILTLFKFGGIYMDLDVVVAKSFDTLPKNFAALESDDTVATGIIGLSKDDTGSDISDKLIRYIVKHFQGDGWTSNGPSALTDIIKQYCKNDVLTNITEGVCEGFELFGPKLFYPLFYTEYQTYFSPGYFEEKDAYLYHIWNGLSENAKVEKNSPYAKFARQYCPNTFNKHKISFGEEDVIE